MNELIRYLMENMYIDFQGDLSMDTVRGLLASDNSREARALLSKLQKDNSVEDMLITLADCLKEQIPTGISESQVQEQLDTYANS